MSDIFGLQMDSPMARSIINTGEFQKVENVPCDVDVFSQNAFLVYGDARNNFRPSLVVQGRVRSVVAKFESHEQKVYFASDEDNCPYISYIYDFNADEWKSMIDAGYGSGNFQIPDIFVKNVFEQMPAPCDIYILPENPDEPDDTPIFIFDTRSWYSISTDAERCGYELGYNFEKTEPEDEFEDVDEIQEEDVTDTEYIHEDEEEYEEEAEPVEETPEDESILEQAKRIQARVEEESEKYKADIQAANDRVDEDGNGIPDEEEYEDEDDDEEDENGTSSKRGKKKHKVTAKTRARMKEASRRLGTVDQKEEVAETEAESMSEADFDAAF